MTNMEAAATAYAREREAAYIRKRGGAVSARAAFNVFCWAYDRFMKNPETIEGAGQ